jgi:hypothetical protein
VIRFVLRRKHKADPDPGCGTVALETLDVECPELEAALTRGGVSQYSYDITELVGAEILPVDRGNA